MRPGPAERPPWCFESSSTPPTSEMTDRPCRPSALARPAPPGDWPVRAEEEPDERIRSAADAGPWGCSPAPALGLPRRDDEHRGANGCRAVAGGDIGRVTCRVGTGLPTGRP